MAQATDQQMQVYADQRIRPRAEQARALIASLRDDKASLDSVYERANGVEPWADARTDGPPKLLTQQDMLVFNSVATLLLKCVDGTATVEEVGQLAANWPVFQSACVRPIGA
jgi:hypothetical protein